MKAAPGIASVAVRSERPVRSVPALSPQQLRALRTYAEIGNQTLAAEAMGISAQTLKSYLSESYLKLGVQSGLEAFRAVGWLSLSLADSHVVAASLADIEARLAAIHAESGALLAELRSAA